MAAKKEKELHISYWAAHLTTIVSVCMLLVLVGAIAMLGIAADRAADSIKEQQQLSVIMADSVTNEQATALAAQLRTRDFVHTANVITKEQALADWNTATGDDVAEIAGTNFFTPEIELTISARYATPQALRGVQKTLEALPGADEVVIPDSEMLASMDSFMSRTLLLLGIVAVVMIIISFVLINNTVLLTIYSRRFTIHTMQLVGATPGFIRRPFIVGNLMSGLTAALIAVALLSGALFFVLETQMPELAEFLSCGDMVLVAGILIVAGMGLCALAALIATNRYLHRDYDKLFA